MLGCNVPRAESMETERHSPRYSAIEAWSPGDILEAMIEGQFAAVAAVRAARPALEEAALAMERRLRDGGRLGYAGAGTSGRLAIQDGAELTPTFSWPQERLLLLIALNLLSSRVMIRLGRVYRGLMVDLTAVNKKLLRRSEKILLELSGGSREEVHAALRRAEGNVKTALLLLEGCDPEEAARMLDRSGGRLREAKALIETRRGAKKQT